jgi:hypothetical protein
MAVPLVEVRNGASDPVVAERSPVSVQHLHQR